MALWGNKDTKAVTGTVTTIQTDATITGAGTAFTTELKVGQTLVIATVPYKIASIQSDTALELEVAYAAVGAAGLVVTANESPAYVAHAEKATIYGVDTTEAAETPEITAAGWVKSVVGTGGRTGRVTYETLVSMRSIQGDAEDVAFPDARITITTQPLADSVTAPAATSFTVIATATQSATIVYDWEVSTDAGSIWADATGGVYSGETTNTLAISDSTGLNTYLFRCNLTATGAPSVTTSAVELTVA